MIIAGRRQERLEETATRLRASAQSTKILAVRTDLTVEKDVEHLFHEVQKNFGRPADVVLANAGWVSGLVKAGEDPVDNWWKVWVSTILNMQNASGLG